MESLDCLFIGSVTKDIMMHMSSELKRDSRVVADMVVNTGGGIAGTAASAFSLLGGKAGIITAVGDDEAGAFARNFINSLGLSYTGIIEIPGKATPFSSILVEPDGKRLIAFYGGCIKSLTMEALDKDAVSRAGTVHLGGLDEDFTEELVKYIKENTNALVSVDGGNLSKKCIDAILDYTDIFIPDNKTAERAFGPDLERACVSWGKRGVKTVCITLGDKGSIAYEDGKLYKVPPVKAKVLDTTGAGDNFHGAFLYCKKRGWDIEKSLKFSNAFSGLCCEGLGGPSSEPTLEKTLEKMKEYEK